MKASARPRVVVTDHAFLDVEQERLMAKAHDAEFEVFDCKDEEATILAVLGASVALVNFAPITREVLGALPKGATVVRYGIGYDNVDLASAEELGIHVANVPDYGVQTVADHAAASLLSLARRLPAYADLLRENTWARPADVGTIRGLRSTVVGLVGMGRIAQEVVRRLQPFGCTFLGHDPFCAPGVFSSLGVEKVSLTDLAARSHAVSLHAPVTEQTRRMVDQAFLSALPHGAFLVNTARGALVDESALAAALRSGQLAGASLDVTDPEPLSTDSPLRTAPNLSLTPHAAFYDQDSLLKLQLLASEEAGRALRHEPLRCPVNQSNTAGTAGAAR